MKEVRFSLEIARVAFWTAGLRSIDQWRSWDGETLNLELDGASPRPEFVPPMVRRRCSELSRAMLAVTDACLEKDFLEDRPTIVFSSRHGEANTTVELLRSLAAEEELSPMSFSLSVHNATAGIYSIASASKKSTNSISVSEEIFSNSMFEAAGIALDDKHGEVILVLGEESFPVEFSCDQVGRVVPHAIAIWLRVACGMSAGMGLPRISLCSGAEHKGRKLDSFEFIRALLRGDQSVYQASSRECWELEVGAPLSDSFFRCL